MRPGPSNDDITREYYARREIWGRKPQIRLVYERWMRKMRPYLPSEGPLLEVGSGSGLLKEFLPGVILTDVVDLPWIDQVADCMDLPFESNSVGGIVGFDLLHHVAQPHAFLREAARVLMPGGRVLLMEPYITPASFLGYRILHHEKVNLHDYHDAAKTDPWEGNLALANLVFARDLKTWDAQQPNLSIINSEIFSFLDFQLAAGFKPYAFVPHAIFRAIVKADDFLRPLMRWIGFRIFVVLEKR